MSFFSQLMALLRKNILLKKRNWKQTLGELFYPIYMVGIVVFIKVLTIHVETYPFTLTSPIMSLTNYESTNYTTLVNGSAMAQQENQTFLVYSPNDNFTTQFMNEMLTTLNRQQFNTTLTGPDGIRADQLRALGVESAQQILDVYKQRPSNEFFAAIEFTNTSTLHLFI
jgi:hypothetical protein